MLWRKLIHIHIIPGSIARTVKQSWTEMWHQILPETELKIEANLSESKSIHYIDQMEGTFYLTWSVVFM